MLQWYAETELARFLFALTFFALLGFRDWWRNPHHPARLHEYAFLAYGAVVASGYGLLHDQVTVTLSPEYFRIFKGVADGGAGLRAGVAMLAIRATYWAGVVIAAAILVANNPHPRLPRLPYDRLRWRALAALGCAGVAALIGLIAVSRGGAVPPEIAQAVPDQVARTRFLMAWGMHIGSYLGGAAGGVIAVVGVWQERNRIARAR